MSRQNSISISKLARNSLLSPAMPKRRFSIADGASPIRKVAPKIPPAANICIATSSSHFPKKASQQNPRASSGRPAYGQAQSSAATPPPSAPRVLSRRFRGEPAQRHQDRTQVNVSHASSQFSTCCEGFRVRSQRGRAVHNTQARIAVWQVQVARMLPRQRKRSRTQ